MIIFPYPFYLYDWSYSLRDLNREPWETVRHISWVKNDYERHGDAIFPFKTAFCSKCGERFQHSNCIHNRTTCVYCLKETLASDRELPFLLAKRAKDMAERDAYMWRIQCTMLADAKRVPLEVFSVVNDLKEKITLLDAKLNDLNT